MSYQLGIDLGTTYTAAAINRGSERAPAGADVVTLGARSATVASVLYLADDGSILVGEAAERRALSDPDRVVREFKRRIGDEIPLMIGGRPHQAHELAARLVRWVVDQVSEREGGPPRRIAVTHPASWGAHKKDLLGRALGTVGLTVTFLAEPQAAAVSYASAERVEPGSTIAVYDLGGGTFDAAVVRKTGTGTFELLGQPEGIDNLGGVDFDEVVFGHVCDGMRDAGNSLDALDPDDPNVLSAVARLRRECVEAKEALSSDTEATIPVLLPELRTQSRLVRAEFETMIRPALEETVEALRRAVGSAGLTPNDLTAVLLVGGSSRIPLVSQLVSDELGRPVAVDADPKTAIALGAALAISPQPAGAAAAGAAGAPGAASPGGPPARPGGLGIAGAAAGAAYSSTPRPPERPRPTNRSEPARPDARVEPAAFVQQQTARPAAGVQRPDFGGRGDEHDPYAEPEKRRPTGMLIGVGGVVAIAAILATVFLWPSSTDANSDGTGNSADLTPSESVAPPAPRIGNGGANNGGTTPKPVQPPAKTPAPTKAPTTPQPSNNPQPSDDPKPSADPKPSNGPKPSINPSPNASAPPAVGGTPPTGGATPGTATPPAGGGTGTTPGTTPGGPTSPGAATPDGGPPPGAGGSDSIDQPVSRPATPAAPTSNPL